MRSKSISLTTLLAAGAAAVAIVAAPIAAAAPTGAANPGPVQTACGSTGPGTECVTPGNAQINDAPPGVNYYPYGDFGLAASAAITAVAATAVAAIGSPHDVSLPNTTRRRAADIRYRSSARFHQQ